jgi:hypothetical protein
MIVIAHQDASGYRDPPVDAAPGGRVGRLMACGD